MIEIERASERLKIVIWTSKPGMVIYVNNKTVYVTPKIPQ